MVSVAPAFQLLPTLMPSSALDLSGRGDDDDDDGEDDGDDDGEVSVASTPLFKE